MQPTEICTQAWNSRSRFIGRWPVKPSNSKKPCAVMLSLVRNSASLCTWPGPKATSTNGNSSNTCSLSDCDQQPPMPITRSGSSAFSRLASPRWPTSRLSAFSRIEQVLKRIRSAPSRSRRLAVAERLEHALHPLRVVLVHLAPEGGQVVRLHNPQAKGVRPLEGSTLAREAADRPARAPGDPRTSARRRGGRGSAPGWARP